MKIVGKQKKGKTFSQQMLPLRESGGDHRASPGARMLWELILAIVGMGWVFPFSVRRALLFW